MITTYLKPLTLPIALLLLTIQMKANPEYSIIKENFHGYVNETTSYSSDISWHRNDSNKNEDLLNSKSIHNPPTENTGNKKIRPSKVFYTSGCTETLWKERFDLPDGTTSDSGATAWTTENSSSGNFHVNNDRFLVEDTGKNKKGIWTSESIDISGKDNVKIELNIFSKGDMEDSGDSRDFIDIYYRLDGGDKIRFSQNSGSINNNSSSGATVSKGSLNGNSLQIIVKSRTTASGEKYYFDNVKVTAKTSRPEASASVSGPLSCDTPSVTLFGNSSRPDVTYSWTGPDNFNSTLQNPTVNKEGSYKLVVTHPNSGCSSSYIVNVISLSTVETNIWLEKFNLSNGTTSDSGATAWTTENSSSGNFHVDNNRFLVQDTGEDKRGIWTSESIDISGKNNVKVSLDIFSTGDMEDSGDSRDYIDAYYRLNGGDKIRFSKNSGKINGNSTAGATISVGSLNGNSLQIIVKSRTTSSNELYYFDNVKVTETQQGSIDATASVDGVLSCTINSVTITGASSASNVTYAWTGPDGFTANTAVINVSEPGEYILTVTSDTGCTGTATAMVVRDNSLDVSASVSGTLGCSITSVTLFGNSTTPNVTYIWTGPDTFSSTLQNPTVNKEGSYTLTVTDPNSGCTASDMVNVVTSNSTETDIWLEKFNLPDGTTSDSGATAWTTENSSSGNFHVDNNRFLVQDTGKDKKGIWTSETIDISGSNDVKISVDIFSTGDMEDSGEKLDFIDIYYRLDGGDKIRFSKNSGSINGSSTAGATVSVGSLNGNTLQIIVKSRTTSSNELYHFDNVTVTATQQGSIDVTATVDGDGVLTCTNTSVTITGASSANNVTYAWTGPDGFTANTAVINVNEPGEYILTVTNDTGCTGTATATVTEEVTLPDVSASVSGTLSCTTSSVTLSGNSTTQDVTYSWIGPDNFSSTLQNPTVSKAGSYTLTVTDPNGCTSSYLVNVVSSSSTETNIWLEEFNLPNGTTSDSGTTAWTTQNSSSGNFHVNNNRFLVEDTGKDKKGIWTSEAIDISGSNDVKISLDLFSKGDMENCGSKLDFIDVYYRLDGGEKIRFSKNSGSINNNNTAGATVSVGSLNGNTLQIIVKSRTTASGEKYYFDNVKVAETQQGGGIDATATVDGTLTCTNNSVTITGASSANNVTYAWTGPNGFTANTAVINVSEPGEYILTVTSDTGCTGTATATVTQEATPPDVSASVSGPLSCGTPTVTLLGSSTTPNVTYNWTGPNNFSSTLQNPTANTVGSYTLVVTDPASGCTASDMVDVVFSNSGFTTIWLEEFNLPDETIVDTGATAWTRDVSDTAIPSSFASTKTSTTFNPFFEVGNNRFFGNDLNGEGIWRTEVIDISAFTDISLSLDMTAEGSLESDPTDPQYDYYRVYYKLNNGPEIAFNNGIQEGPFSPVTATAGPLNGNTVQIVIRMVNTGSNEFYDFDNVKVSGFSSSGGSIDATASVDGELTCTNTSVTITGASSAGNVTYAWMGPNGFTANTAVITVNEPGEYILTVTSDTGCSATATATVPRETTPPEFTATADGIITCDNPQVTLTATPLTPNPNVIFSWSGFTAGENPVNVTAEGVYTVTALDIVTGCTAQKTVTVTAELDDLEITVTATGNGIITCSNPQVTLTATPSIPNPDVIFIWSGFTAGENPVNVIAEGVYTVTALDIVTGCIAQKTVTVTAELDDLEITVTATGNGIITCDSPQVTLTATPLAPNPNVIFSWSGFTAGENPVNVIAEGTYTVTALDIVTGCTAQKTVTVTAELEEPELTVTTTANGIITCSNPQVTLTAASTTPNVTYSWAGPNGFTANTAEINVGQPGEYIVTVTNDKGCTATATVTVSRENTPPELTVTTSADGIITCDNPQVTLTASSTTPDVTFSWTGFTAGQNPVNVTAEGAYMVTATNIRTGCTAQKTVIVTAELEEPELTVTTTANGIITCSNPQVTLTAASTTPNVTYSWAGPNGFTANTAEINVGQPGEYIVTVTNDKGCTATATVTVSRENTPPELTVTTSADGIITCDNPQVTLTASSTTPDVTFSWTGFTAGQNPVNVTAEGAYMVTATNIRSGCTAQKTVIVTAELEEPELTVTTTANGIITCSNPQVTLTAASTTPNVTYSWAGPNGFTANTAEINVGQPGEYMVNVTNDKGCTATATVTVSRENTPPEFTATADGTITCDNPQVTLTASSTTPNVTFSWTGFTAGENPVNVTAEGAYMVTATNTLTGCTAQKTVIVTAELEEPELTVTTTANGIITCSNPQVTLTAASTTPNVTYSWAGPNGFTANTAEINVGQPGEYIVTVTNDKGCTATATVTVSRENTPPEFTATADGTITCDNPQVILTASSTTPNVTFSWTGFTAGENPVNVTAEGAYMVTATNTLTGCTAQKTVIVTSTCDQINIEQQSLSDLEMETFIQLNSKAYPNPSKDKVTIDFDSTQEGNATLEIYAMTGVLVSSFLDIKIEADKPYQVAFNEDGRLPSGVYLYVLRLGNRSIKKRIVLTE